MFIRQYAVRAMTQFSLVMAGRPCVVPNSTPNMPLISLLVCGLFLVCACDGRDTSAQEHRPPVAQPQKTENSAQDAERDAAVSLAFSGSTLTYYHGMITESFIDDGRWFRSSSGRVPYLATGTWTSRHGRICVRAEEVTNGLDELFPPFREICREVRIANRVKIVKIENISRARPIFYDVEMRRHSGSSNDLR